MTRRTVVRPMTRTARLACVLAALAVVACSSAKKRGEDSGPSARAARERRPAELTPVAELGERRRAILFAYGRGGDEWAAMRATVLERPAETRFLVDNLVLELLRAYRSSRLSTSTDLDSPFERAQAELVALQESSAPVLAELLAVGDGVAAFVAAQTLERIGRPAALHVRRLLSDPDPETRRRAAELLGRLPHLREDEEAVQSELARRLATDPEWRVRAQAAQALASRAYASGTLEAPSRALIAALGDEDPSVRRRAATGLARLGDVRAVPALINLLERSSREGDVPVFEASEAALKKLLAVEPTRRVRDWRALWLARRDELER